MITKGPTLLQKLYQKYLREFFVTMGREPITPKEWMDIKNLAVREINATTTASKTKKPWHQGWNPKVIQGGKGIGSLIKSGDVTLGTAPKTKLSTLEGKKQKLDKAINREEWIAQKKAENKAAIERFKEKKKDWRKDEDWDDRGPWDKSKKKTVEDFRDEGDWDPGGMASGGRIGYAVGKIVKGGRWFLKNLRKALNDIEADKGFKNLTPDRKEGLTSEIKNLIKSIEGGAPLPEDMIKTIRHDPKFAQISKTRSTDPDLYEFEDVILNYGKKGDVVDEQVKILDDFDVTGQTKHAEGGRVPLMYGGDPGFAFEYGGSWADWHEKHRDTMPVEQYIQTKLPKERLPFREMQSGGLAYMLGEPTYMKYSAGGSVGHAPWHKPTGQKPPSGPEETPPPQVVGTPDPLKAPRGIPSVAPKNMDPAYMQQKMMQQAMMGRGMMGQGPRPMAKEGGRIGFKLGGINKGRRAFMKWLAGIMGTGIAAGTGLLKFGKAAKVVPKVAETVVTMEKTAGMPTWFPALVNRVIKEGDDVSKKLATVEREIVHTKKISAGEEVTVYRNLDTGNVRVEYGPPLVRGKRGKEEIIRASNDPETVHLEYKAPEVIESGKYKGQKTKSEFSAAESEPEVVNWDGDIEWSGINEVNKVEDLVTDTSSLKQFATKKKPTIGEIVESSKKKKYQQKLQEDTMEQVDYIEQKHGPFPEPDEYAGAYSDEMVDVFEKYRGKASGGLAGLLGE